MKLLGAAASLADLGRRFGPDFYEREALYLIAEEWAETVDDVIVRRTKHGLRMSADERAQFASWIESRAPRRVTRAGTRGRERFGGDRAARGGAGG